MHLGRTVRDRGLKRFVLTNKNEQANLLPFGRVDIADDDEDVVRAIEAYDRLSAPSEKGSYIRCCASSYSV